MVVSENAGEIIFTKQFQSFVQEQELQMWVCRKADPQSKGKVENLIKFVKTSFFSARCFVTDNLTPPGRLAADETYFGPWNIQRTKALDIAPTSSRNGSDTSRPGEQAVTVRYPSAVDALPMI